MDLLDPLVLSRPSAHEGLLDPLDLSDPLGQSAPSDHLGYQQGPWRRLDPLARLRQLHRPDQSGQLALSLLWPQMGQSARSHPWGRSAR